jgi:hypothetical protein
METPTSNEHVSRDGAMQRRAVIDSREQLKHELPRMQQLNVSPSN